MGREKEDQSSSDESEKRGNRDSGSESDEKKKKRKKWDRGDDERDNDSGRGKDANGSRGEGSEKTDDAPAMKPSAVDHAAELKEWQRRRAEKSKSGGVYVPPHKLREMQNEITDKASEKFQR